MAAVRTLLAALAAALLLAGCDVFDSIPRPDQQIHMYGSAVDANTDAPVANASIVIQIDGHAQRFTGSYEVMVPVGHPLVVSVTAPGYQDYQVRTELRPQGSDDLRSLLLLRPAGQ